MAWSGELMILMPPGSRHGLPTVSNSNRKDDAMADNQTQDARFEQALMRSGAGRRGAHAEPGASRSSSHSSRHASTRSSRRARSTSRTRAWSTDMAEPRTHHVYCGGRSGCADPGEAGRDRRGHRGSRAAPREDHHAVGEPDAPRRRSPWRPTRTSTTCRRPARLKGSWSQRCWQPPARPVRWWERALHRGTRHERR